MARSISRLVALLLVLGACSFAAAGPPSEADEAQPCCFTNPRFAGFCTVVPGQDESCASILAYLNNQVSTGRTYCGSTTVRGGWSQVPCGDEASDEACGEPAASTNPPDSPRTACMAGSSNPPADAADG